MYQRASVLSALVICMVACAADPQSENLVEDSHAPNLKNERTSCADYYVNARKAILDTLEGKRFISLMGLGTRVSSLVNDASHSVMNAYCNSAQRSLDKEDREGYGVTLSIDSECKRLIETIDTQCLEPLSNQGIPLNQQCHTTLISLNTRSSAELLEKLRMDSFCSNLTIGLSQGSK